MSGELKISNLTFNLNPGTVHVPMRDYRFPIFWADDVAAEMRAHKELLEEIAARAFELLSKSEPDTFLGRQHHPLIPLPHEED